MIWILSTTSILSDIRPSCLPVSQSVVEYYGTYFVEAESHDAEPPGAMDNLVDIRTILAIPDRGLYQRASGNAMRKVGLPPPQFQCYLPYPVSSSG
jgi:hypothetical protein